LAAGRRLKELGADTSQLDAQVFGIDLHRPSLAASTELLEAEALDAHLLAENIFDVPTPDQLGCPLPAVDGVIGNPPFVRYQEHRGRTRQLSAQAALRQGVRLSGLASSWASVVIHSAGFLKPEGRLAMVLPAELLTVHYAEPVRRWLRNRFSGVTLVMFERLQFADALEKVVLVLAHGSGGCESFSVVYVSDADELEELKFGDAVSVMPPNEGKWTDLLIPLSERRLYRSAVEQSFTPLASYGAPTLGTVTGANDYFAISEATRLHYGLEEGQVRKMCPPGTRHLCGPSFGIGDWRRLRDAGERVWMFCPDASDDTKAVKRYVSLGEAHGVPEAYKCQIRTPWWRPPRVTPPDLFFTYMSHRYPRLISNAAGVTFVNSMHGIKLRPNQGVAKQALPLLVLNSITMLGAEVCGRSYGGGLLKMEPREAASLPLPRPEILAEAWEQLKGEKSQLDNQLRKGLWVEVSKRVDQVLLRETIGLSSEDVQRLHEAARSLRERRIGASPTT
jgi:adenine-specific DNA methylase